MSEYLVQFNNISKFFGKVIALKDVTMKLRKGEIMCLLGDNGAGKSTLIKTLALILFLDLQKTLTSKASPITLTLVKKLWLKMLLQMRFFSKFYLGQRNIA